MEEVGHRRYSHHDGFELRHAPGRGPSVGHKSNKQKRKDDEPECHVRAGKPRTAKAFGLLVVLGFGVAAFTPAPYPRHRL